MIIFLAVFGVILLSYSIYCILDLKYLENEIAFLDKKVVKKYTKNTYGYENFISQKDRIKLIQFIEKNLNHFKIRTDERELLCTIQDLPNYPKKVIKKLRDRIIKLEKIGEHYPDIIYKDAISIIYEGGFHDYHRDINYLNWYLVRYNIILSKPEEGGLSLYGDEINDWDECTIWKCVAGNIKHGVTKVIGERPRIVLCLGFLIPMDAVIKNQHKKPVLPFSELPQELKYLEVID
jgi:hypothetical protein